MAHQKSSSAYIVCCCWIYAIVSADLSYEINKGGGVLAAMGGEEEQKVGHTLNIQCSLHYKSATLGFSSIYDEQKQLNPPAKYCEGLP